MRIFALSDVHADYDTNKRWIECLSSFDFQEDVLILAGDITDSLVLLEWCLKTLASKFKAVLYVPGNHDLWVIRDGPDRKSLDKFGQVRDIVENCYCHMRPFHLDALSIVPLFSWYDYSFGMPESELLATWMDFRACKWPAHYRVEDVATHFLRLNEPFLDVKNRTVISFSHFLPRIDVMPSFIPISKRFLYPVLGTSRLEAQIRQLGSRMHVYGHSHVNRKVEIDGIVYVNNAFGYPQETSIASKQLACILEI